MPSNIPMTEPVMYALGVPEHMLRHLAGAWRFLGRNVPVAPWQERAWVLHWLLGHALKEQTGDAVWHAAAAELNIAIDEYAERNKHKVTP